MLKKISRSWNGKELELLAPAGTFEIFRDIIDSACDAVYLGGQSLNMRMIRKGYNLSNDELKDAISMSRERDKKLYVTVNSLIDPGELHQAEDYLGFLHSIEPDGIIVQDPAIINIIKDNGYTLPLHASVMMNVHNLDMIRQLQTWGFTRVVLSREMTLEQVRFLSRATDVELEYFTHGDMCSVNGSQCLYSSFVFGMSSNRGRCLKPCRWEMSGADKPFPLAVKDLSMYSHLSELVLSGVQSFKIEGRMRGKDFIVGLINAYGQALDRFLDDPFAGRNADMADMEPFKKRDYSTAYAFGKPGQENINIRGEGSGAFYSTGKMFSTPVKEGQIKFDGEAASVAVAENVRAVALASKNHGLGKEESPDFDQSTFSLRVKTDDAASAASLAGCGIQRIYLSTEPFSGEGITLPSASQVLDLDNICAAHSCELFIALPRMTDEPQGELIQGWLQRLAALKRESSRLPGLAVGHVGMLSWPVCRQFPLHGDSSLNIYNQSSAAFLCASGLTGWTPSLELPYASLLELPEAWNASGRGPGEIELMLHGCPTLMYMDHDVSANGKNEFQLDTGKSTLRIRKDIWERYHLLPDSDYSLMPRLPELIASGYRSFRLELQDYSQEDALTITSAAASALKAPADAAHILQALPIRTGGYSYGAQQF